MTWPPTPLGHPDDRDDLDALVDDVLGSRARPLRWQTLDTGQATAAWTALDQWVRWLVRRYSIDHREIPPCWARHGDLVEELSALHTPHLAAFDPAGPPTGPAEWHHTLAATRTRLATAAARTGCRPQEHRDPHPVDWATDPPPDDYQARLTQAVERDLAHRQ